MGTVIPGDIFDGVNFRGIQLASDDNMVPDSQRGYAPTIHGISREHPGLVSARTGMKFTRVRYLQARSR